jgi:hypothetical protein
MELSKNTISLIYIAYSADGVHGIATVRHVNRLGRLKHLPLTTLMSNKKRL